MATKSSLTKVHISDLSTEVFQNRANSSLPSHHAEFRTFVEKTETELYTLFKSIDHDNDGRLDKGELRSAFKRAGLMVPNSKLDQFFAEVDGNNDVRTYKVLSFALLTHC